MTNSQYCVPECAWACTALVLRLVWNGRNIGVRDVRLPGQLHPVPLVYTGVGFLFRPHGARRLSSVHSRVCIYPHAHRSIRVDRSNQTCAQCSTVSTHSRAIKGTATTSSAYVPSTANHLLMLAAHGLGAPVAARVPQHSRNEHAEPFVEAACHAGMDLNWQCFCSPPAMRWTEGPTSEPSIHDCEAAAWRHAKKST